MIGDVNPRGRWLSVAASKVATDGQAFSHSAVSVKSAQDV